MAFYKKTQKAINGKWYATSVTVGKPVSTDEIAEQLEEISTVSRGDAYNVLKDLAAAMRTFLASGRTVKLEGVGTFYYQASARGNGRDTAAEVTANDIGAVRVRFIPEVTYAGGNATRGLVSPYLSWEEWGGSTSTPGDGSDTPPSGGGDDTDPV